MSIWHWRCAAWVLSHTPVKHVHHRIWWCVDAAIFGSFAFDPISFLCAATAFCWFACAAACARARMCGWCWWFVKILAKQDCFFLRLSRKENTSFRVLSSYCEQLSGTHGDTMCSWWVGGSREFWNLVNAKGNRQIIYNYCVVESEIIKRK